MMSVVWKFFVRGDTSQWGTIVPPSDPGIVIKNPKIDLAAMKELVTKSELRQRVSLLPHKRCEVDQCFILHTPELTSFLRTAEAIQRSMRNTALGSALLGAAIWLTQSVMTRGPLPYVRIALLVSSLAGAILAVLRYLQVTNYIKQKQTELVQAGVDFAVERRAHYNKSHTDRIQDVIDCSDKKLLHPLEGEAFFKEYFSQWARGCLDEEPTTPEEKIKWVQTVLAEASPLSERAAKVFLTAGCIAPSKLMESFKPIFQGHYAFKDTFQQSHQVESLFYTQKLLELKRDVRTIMAEAFPAMINAYTRCANLMNVTLRAGYVSLALDAALSNDTPFGKWFNQINLDLQLVQSPQARAIYYDPVRLFLQAAAIFVEKGTGEIPKVSTPLFTPPPMPDIDKRVLDLDDAFYERAKGLTPAAGTQEEYLKFLEEVKAQKSFTL
jgi:hypothetical protein